MKNLFIAVTLLLGLSACTTTLGVRDAELRTRDASIRISDGERHRGGGFCPPGQAMKGRC
ncbi:hypothetical protein [Zobellella iuensis]|uniref:Lipoprotein n=1 Tax=Zobellella iuensis TaxID=2803811 RepID=A0ABS1QPP1_9GAMM|nr:hypothetical protein [Zobellella iuensis]MBL1376823.1 hypothetical protein [Zobellella iuensis]